jgi:glycosyltransferase involved in cell wall biosynthesis
MQNKPHVSVIIPTYRDWERLKLCIAALEKQTYPADLFEVIIVNNDSEDLCPNFSLPKNYKLIAEAKPGSYAARNAALKIAKGEVVAFTDSDCQPQRDWLRSAVDLFGTDLRLYRIGGKVSLIVGENKKNIAEIYEKAYAFRQQDFVYDKGMAATANMVTKKAVFDKIGDFNENLMSGGDAEWGMRASAQGFKIKFSNDCVVWHPARSLLSEIVQKTKREAGGHYGLLEKKSKVLLMSYIIFGFLPPIKSIFRVFRDPSLSFSEKTVSVIVRYYLRLVSTWEIVKLALALKKAERI